MMSKTPVSQPRIAPLQRVTAVPITDPLAQAALDEQRQRAKQEIPAAAAQVLELARQLSPQEQQVLCGALLRDASLEQQLALLDHLTAQLSPQVLRALAEQRQRAAGRLLGELDQEDALRPS